MAGDDEHCFWDVFALQFALIYQNLLWQGRFSSEPSLNVWAIMWAKTRLILETVKFEHTVFALPFAYVGLVLAEGGWPRWPVFTWATLAMVGFRTAGMLLNRLFDKDIDRENPRTKTRAIPAGLLTPRAAWVGVGLGLGVYFFSAYRLNALCFALAPIPLILAWVYPFLKRWTFLSHFGIGIILAAAPLGGWLAVRGTFDGAPFLMAFAVLFWVAGFDVIYSLQDLDFDRQAGLHSIPVRFGEKGGIVWAASFHVLTVLFLVLFGYWAVMGPIYFFGLAVVTGFLVRQHGLVLRHGLRRVDEAFFTLNAAVSMAIFVFTFADLLVG